MFKKEHHNIPKEYDKNVKDSPQSAEVANSAIVGSSSAEKQRKLPKVTKPSKKVLIIIGFILLVVFIAGWLVFGASNSQVVVLSRVCSDDDVATYNSVSKYKPVEGTVEYALDEEGLKNLAADIESRQFYQSDPTCQTILLEVAIYNKDYNAAEETYSSILELHEKHKYVDSNLNTGGPLYAYDNIIQQLLPPDQGEGSQEPQGGN